MVVTDGPTHRLMHQSIGLQAARHLHLNSRICRPSQLPTCPVNYDETMPLMAAEREDRPGCKNYFKNYSRFMFLRFKVSQFYTNVFLKATVSGFMILGSFGF